jgi:hypothetical protein
MPKSDYSNKIDEFINENNFKKIEIDPTKSYNNQIYDVIYAADESVMEGGFSAP